ncbi:MAG: acyl-CoA dehydrogenase family protein [Deltaproteobacteria bacterium]|nr:acyl-CoA dehydrogenase family protein [Deltaproteobacteria bacterium]MBI3389263.1 acyl-CoA dehydrogenase family protein [Deltaproteobacteria bacterium]
MTVSESWQSFDLFAPTDEHRLLAQTLADFVTNEVAPQADAFNREERFNLALFRRAGELGLLGLTAPDVYGGAGMDAVAAVIVHEALSTADPGFALAYLAHSVLFVNNFSRNASAAQCQRVLPRAVSGQWIGGMCMTEPDAGTDVLGMRSTARREGDHYVLNGRKTFITNGALDETTLGDVFLVYAKTGERSLSTFLVEKGFAGFSLGQKLKDKLGVRASMTAELVFDTCIVPVDNLIGAEGDSTRHMMRNLELERLTLSAMSLGIAQRCLQVMVDYANQRKTFGVLIREHGQIQRLIAESYAEYKAARCYVYETARRLDLTSYGNRVDADGVKLFAARVGKDVADRAIQVLGGNGYMGEYVVERLWRDAKLLEIGGGTLEAHQKNITKDLSRAPELIRR